MLSSRNRKEMGVPPMFCFFLDYSDSSRTLVRRHTGAHGQLPQKVIRYDRFPCSIVSRNIVAVGGEGGWKLARIILRLVERRPHSSSEDCEIDTQHNPSTSLFEITYTLHTFVLDLTLFMFKAPNYMLARTLTERVV